MPSEWRVLGANPTSSSSFFFDKQAGLGVVELCAFGFAYNCRLHCTKQNHTDGHGLHRCVVREGPYLNNYHKEGLLTHVHYTYNLAYLDQYARSGIEASLHFIRLGPSCTYM